MARKRELGTEILEGIRAIKQGDIGRAVTFPPLAEVAAGRMNPLGEKMDPKHPTIVERLATEAIRLGAQLLEVEYKDGYEEVFATKDGTGQGIARLRRSSPDAVALREELHRIVKRKVHLAVDEAHFELRGSVYDSFGEDAFRVELRRVRTSV